MIETLVLLCGVVLVGGAVIQKDQHTPVDLDVVARDLKNDPATQKAEREIAAALAAVKAYHAVVGEVMRGEKVWSDGSSNVSTRLPDELDTKVLKARAGLEKARCKAFDRVARPVCDILLETDRRQVEEIWGAFTTAMARLDQHEKVIRNLRPRGVAYRAASAVESYVSSTALTVWRSRTWPTARTARPKKPVVNEREWLEQLVTTK